MQQIIYLITEDLPAGSFTTMPEEDGPVPLGQVAATQLTQFVAPDPVEIVPAAAPPFVEEEFWLQAPAALPSVTYSSAPFFDQDEAGFFYGELEEDGFQPTTVVPSVALTQFVAPDQNDLSFPTIVDEDFAWRPATLAQSQLQQAVAIFAMDDGNMAFVVVPPANVPFWVTLDTLNAMRNAE